MAEKTRVLVVDDDVNFCGTLSKILRAKGYETTTARDGFGALELVKEKDFDAVLMDIKMPVMDGVETYKKMKAMKKRMAVILMTAFSVDDMIKDAMKEGVYAVVRKPFDMDTIVNMIEKSKTGALVAIVDDDPGIVRTMKMTLEKKGYGVTACQSGEEAIEMSGARRHNVFFIDMKLPVLNGLETYKEIRKTNPSAIVVMMTAHRQEMEDLIRQAIENGAYSCIYKPFNMDDAIKIIEEVTKGKKKNK